MMRNQRWPAVALIQVVYIKPATHLIKRDPELAGGGVRTRTVRPQPPGMDSRRPGT